MTTEFNRQEFDAAVLAQVEEALSSRDEEKARLEAEEALREAKETFETLRASLEAKDVKIREYEEALANLDSTDPSVAEISANERIVVLESQVEELAHRTNVAEAALDTIAREETAAGRMSELHESGVALDEDAAEIQYAKVREMSDTEFASYRSELVALKSMYASTSDEEGETTEVELAEAEVATIAESLGCDPSDAKCIALVREVAEKVAEVSTRRRIAAPEGKTEETPEQAADKGTEKKEVASTLSMGDAISKSISQEIQAPAGLRDEISQAWEAVYAERRGENKSE
jgi:hypothetical protein